MNTTILSDYTSSQAVRPHDGLLDPSNSPLHLPSHHLFVEARGSLGAWLFYKKPSPVEVLNDTDGEADNLSNMLVNGQTRIELLSIFARHNPEAISGNSPVTRAFHFGLSIERAYPLPSKLGNTSQLPCSIGLRRLDRIFDRLRQIQIEKSSTTDLIRRYDWSQALFLLDERGRALADEGIQDVRDSLASIEGKVILLTDGSAEWASHIGYRKLCLNQRLDAVWVNY